MKNIRIRPHKKSAQTDHRHLPFLPTIPNASYINRLSRLERRKRHPIKGEKGRAAIQTQFRKNTIREEVPIRELPLAGSARGYRRSRGNI
jgi:hypothetical protein